MQSFAYELGVDVVFPKEADTWDQDNFESEMGWRLLPHSSSQRDVAILLRRETSSLLAEVGLLFFWSFCVCTNRSCDGACTIKPLFLRYR